METWKLSWSKLLPFTKTNVDQIDDSVEGVYRLSKREKDNEKIYVFYVGRGKIKDRLLDHLDEKDNECVKSTIASFDCYFRYSIITREEVRMAAEKKLYKIYMPSCNTIEPSGSDDISVNID